MEYLKAQIEHDFAYTIKNIFSYSNTSIFVRENQSLQEFDYQVDCSFALAKELKKNPLEIANIIIENLQRNDIYEEIIVSKPGFINIKVTKKFLQTYLEALLKEEVGIKPTQNPQTIVVDYASPNVAKEMHVGHLRSSIIGDAICRIFLYLGHKVIKQNHIGDWGTQFGFLIQYIIEHKLIFTNIREVSDAYKEARKQFDTDVNFSIRSKERLLLLQSHDNYTYSIWKDLNQISFQHFNTVFNKLNILLKEEDARGESFYNFMLPDIVEDLVNTGVAEESNGAKVIFLPGFYDKDKNLVPMIIQKSDGGYLYHTTDLAAAKYRINDLKAQRIIYITDARQKQHFEMLVSALKKAEWINEKSVIFNHIAFGTVLGEDKKPFKTRSGDTISLIYLLEEAVARAKEGVKNKYPSMSEEELNEIAHAIGIGALKYADLSSDLTKDYMFSWDKMLSFNGNTAPYIQNAYVRIKSIFRKENIDTSNMHAHSIIISNEEEKKLCLKVTEFPDVIKSIEEKLTPHLLCTYLYDLASLFHNFYETSHISKCNKQDIKLSRLSICHLVANTMKLGLSLLGISVIEKM